MSASPIAGFDQEVTVHNRRELPEGAEVRPFTPSRRSFLQAGAGAGGVSVVGFSSVGTAESALAAPTSRGRHYEPAPFGPVDVGPTSGSYARAVRFGRCRPGQPRPLLATYQSFGGTPFPLYRSGDDGHTWSQQGSILGADAPAGFYLQPNLYELPRAFAGLPK